MHSLFVWIGTSIGVSGVLAAFGWLIVFGQRSMLGVQLAIPGTPELMVMSAEYFLDMLLYFLGLCIDSLPLVVLAVVVLILLLVARYALRSHKWFARLTGCLREAVVRRGARVAAVIGRVKWTVSISMLAVVIAFAELFYYHVPASTINQTLTRDLSLPNPFEPPAMLKGASLRLWKQVKCTHIAGRSTECAATQSADYLKSIKGRHFVSLVFTLALGTILVLLMLNSRATQARPSGAPTSHRWLVNFALVIVILNFIMLPKTYGSIARLPEFPEATVYLVLSEKTKKSFLPNMKTDEDIIDGYVLSEDGETLTIYAKDFEYPILEIPASRVRAVNRRPNNDVLTARLYQLLRLSDQN